MMIGGHTMLTLCQHIHASNAMAVVLHKPKRLTAWSPEVHPAWPRTSRVCVKVSCAPPDASVDPIGSPRVAAVGWQWLPYDSPSASGTGTPARRAKLGIVVRKVLLDLPAQRATAEILARPAPRVIEATDCGDRIRFN